MRRGRRRRDTHNDSPLSLTTTTTTRRSHSTPLLESLSTATVPTTTPLPSFLPLLLLAVVCILGTSSTVANAGRGGQYGSLLSVCQYDASLLQCTHNNNISNPRSYNGTILDCLTHYQSNITQGRCRRWVGGSVVCREAVQREGICDSSRSLPACIRSTSATHFPADCVATDFFKALKDFGRFRRPKAKERESLS